MNDLEKFHLCFIDIYKASGDRSDYILVPAGGELPRQFQEQAFQTEGLELLKSRKSLSRSAFSWGRPGEDVHRELETSGLCVISVESVRRGRLAFIRVHCAGALVAGLVTLAIAWYLTGDRSDITGGIRALLLIGSALVGGFMGWEGVGAIDEATPEHLKIDYRAKQNQQG
jgi:hypothetical protein